MPKKNSIDRRLFLSQCAVSSIAAVQFGNVVACDAEEVREIPAPEPSESPEVGKPYAGWKEGELDLHFIYTGNAESCFHIYPDGTSMLLDAGDYRRKDSTIQLPDDSRRSGEWIARYVERVNPSGKKVDYLMCSHFHSDHCGGGHFFAGKTEGRGNDYDLGGAAQVGEFLRFGEAFDRSYPDYEAPVTAMKQRETLNWLKFVEYQEKTNGLKRMPFTVGRADQLVLKKDPQKYAGRFQILNVCGSGTVCLEAPKPEQEFDPTVTLPTENLYLKYPNNLNSRVNENPLSIGFRLSYGPFRFFTGGDLSGVVLDENGKDAGIEAIVGRTVGKVSVCKANHHASRDAMCPEFVQAVQARVYVNNVWTPGHVNEHTMKTMCSRELYPGERLICPTYCDPEKMKKMADEAWQKDLVKLGGHVVVKAYDEGRKFKVYYLTANDESMTVKAVFGPFDS